MTPHSILLSAAFAVTCLLGPGLAAAQAKQGPPPPPPAGDDALDGDGMGPGRLHRELAEVLYPVGLVRRYSREIGLTDDQTKKLRDLVTATSAKIESLKWDLEREASALTELVRKGEAKAKVEAQLGKVLALENALKTKHLTLLLEVRDVLTAAQRAQLDKVKAEFFEDHPGRGRGRGMGRGHGGQHGGHGGHGAGPRAGF